MDPREFSRRTDLIKEQLGNDQLFKEVNEEVKDDERVREMGAKIQELRIAGHVAEEQEAVSSNRDLIDLVRSEKLGERGFHIDIDDMEEQAESRRREKIEKIHDSLTGEESDSELLRLFELTDEEGKLGEHSVRSPLFRERTRMAFDAYKASVDAFEKLVDYNRMFGIPSKNVPRADRLRGEAHNAIAQEVAQDLDLEFDVARRLVAKIRDGVLPGSGEQDAYSKSISRVGRRFAKHYGNDIADAVEDKLKPLRDMGLTEDDRHA
jgi:hypothetical protein